MGGRELVTGRDGGAIAVEAALLLPLFLLLIMGVLDWGLIMRDTTSVTAMTRVGVRTASALPRSDMMLRTTADAIQKSGSAMPKDSIDYILIYEANASGLPGSSTSIPEALGASPDPCAVLGASGTCQMYTWNDASDTFDRAGTSTWVETAINACPGDPGATSVGVYMRSTHDMLTGLFFATKTLSDRAVLSFEPLPKAVCK